jgi:hypothetical protein
MMSALLVFLIGALVIAAVIYVFRLVLDMMTLPPEIRQIVLVIVCLILVIILIILLILWVVRGRF